jgi:phosphoribosyl 1,2-cyclic phosphodiesterase
LTSVNDAAAFVKALRDPSKYHRKRKIELTFLGTRGEIKARSRRHRRHSALLVRRGRARIMIDCGTDWLKAFAKIAPTAIVLTHAHDDHAAGLASGASCPVYATQETWTAIARFPIGDARVVEARVPFKIGGVSFEAFDVEHSLRAPDVGYRIDEGGSSLFYVPDVAAICEPHAALDGVCLYIGDGATVTRSMVRRRDHALIGHAPIAAQLGWCAEEGVARAIFTHCGSGIVESDARKIAARVADLGKTHGIEANIAYDGLALTLPRRSR